MNIINPSYEILTDISQYGIWELEELEVAARNCYQSEDKITDQAESAKVLIKKLIDSGHHAMLEHGPSLSVRFICDRGVSHEIVRHRMASFAQESTRYCNYSKDKFNHSITVIKPCFLVENGPGWDEWVNAMQCAENAYFAMLNMGMTAQEARCVLPNSLKTSIIVKANYREWRHILKERTNVNAHPQMRELMVPLLNELTERIPVIFDDIKENRRG